MLTVADDCTRECPVIEVDTSLGGLRVRRVLDPIAAKEVCQKPLCWITDRSFAVEPCSSKGMGQPAKVLHARCRISAILVVKSETRVDSC